MNEPEGQVFINCPFDEEYRPLFEAILFAVHACGFTARCSLEADDASRPRIDKIYRIVEECGLAIHDISRTEPDKGSGLPRFNMPLELGLFLGAKRCGAKSQKRKLCLVLDRDAYRYQQFCSDIAGQDMKAHRGDCEQAIKIVRDWLRDTPKGLTTPLPGGVEIAGRRSLRRFPRGLARFMPQDEAGGAGSDLHRLCHASRRLAEAKPPIGGVALIATKPGISYADRAASRSLHRARRRRIMQGRSRRDRTGAEARGARHVGP